MNLKKWIPALLMAAAATQAIAPVEKYGSLAVKGNKLVDSAGNPVTLRGMSLFWHYHLGGGEFWNRGTLTTLMTDWHASVVRAPIGVEDDGDGTHKQIGAVNDPTNANDYIRRALGPAIDLGLYIIVDWHAHEFHPGPAKAFFGALAKEYGNTPNIIWEIFNEPLRGVPWSQVAAYANEVIPEIRKYSNNVILVGSGDWSSNPQSAGTELDKYSNIAYTIHFYSDHSFWGRIGEAMAKDHAVFASEWGMSSSSGDQGFVPISDNNGNIKKWIDEMESKGVSYCNWSLGNPKEKEGQGPGSETSAALKQNVSITGNWPDGDLTPSGLAIKAHLRSKNPAWTLPDTTLKIRTPLAITSDKKTNFTLNSDSITFRSVYSKKVKWNLVETGVTSGAVKTSTGPDTNIVSVGHVVGVKDFVPIGVKFALGETVNAVLNPLGQKVSYTISPTAGILHRVHETNLSWEGTRLVLPYDLIPAGTKVHVMLRDASGKVVFQAPATMGSYGHIELSQARPRSNGIQILDILTGDESYVRGRLAPKF